MKNQFKFRKNTGFVDKRKFLIFLNVSKEIVGHYNIQGAFPAIYVHNFE